jgi:hypothetical protein
LLTIKVHLQPIIEELQLIIEPDLCVIKVFRYVIQLCLCIIHRLPKRFEAQPELNRLSSVLAFSFPSRAFPGQASTGSATVAELW